MARRGGIDWLAIEAEYIKGQKPVNAIAEEHGISEGSIRSKAKKLGWVRSATDTKREIVAQRLAGITNGIANDGIRNSINLEAEQDVSDMEAGLSVARGVIHRLYACLDSTSDPKELKVIADANQSAINTIRRIRGLDEADTSQAITIERSYGAKR